MSAASWLNISTTNGSSAAVYRLWDAVNRLLTGDMAGKWTIVQVSAAGWTEDASPVDGSWVAIQCETPNADTTKMQVFLGYRAVLGTLAGFGSKAAGLWMAVSPNGGWTEYVGGGSPTGGFFGASLPDWRNGSLKSVGAYSTAAVMGLTLTSGTTNRPGGVWIRFRQGSGTSRVLAARMLVPPAGGAVAMSRCALSFVSAWTAGDTSLVSNANTIVAKTSLDGWDAATLSVPDTVGAYSTPCWGVDAESAAPVGTPVPIYDTVLGKSRGYDEVAQRILASDGDLNGPTETATRWCYGGFSWVREPTRDGSWV